MYLLLPFRYGLSDDEDSYSSERTDEDTPPKLTPPRSSTCSSMFAEVCTPPEPPHWQPGHRQEVFQQFRTFGRTDPYFDAQQDASGDMYGSLARPVFETTSNVGYPNYSEHRRRSSFRM